MRRLFYRTFTAIFAISAMFAVTTPSLAQSDAVDMGHIVDDGAEVRAGAGSSYYLVGRLKKGTVVNIDDRFFEWYKITPPPTVYSYVKKVYVSPGAEKGTGTINRDRAPVFAAAVNGPGESYRRQVDLHKGDAVKIEAEEGDYYKIRSPRHAYVYVRVTSVKRAEFIPADVTTTPTPSVPAPMADPQTVTSTTTVVPATPEAAPEVAPEVAPTVAPEATATVTPTVTVESAPVTTTVVTKVVDPAPVTTPAVTKVIAPEPAPVTATVVTKVVEPAPEVTPQVTPEPTPEVTSVVTATTEHTMHDAAGGARGRIVTASSETTKAVVDTTVKAAEAAVNTGADAIDTATASKAGTTTREVTQTAVTKAIDTTQSVAKGTGQTTVKAGTATLDTTKSVVTTTATKTGEAADAAANSKVATTTGGAVKTVATTTIDTTKSVVTTTATKTGEAVDAAANSKVATTTGGAVKTAATTTVDATKSVASGAATTTTKAVDATVQAVTEEPTVADRTREAASEAADAASRAMNATVRGAGVVVSKTGEAVTTAAVATREFIDPTPEPIVSTPPVRTTPLTVAPMPTTVTRPTVSSDPPPRVSYTPTGDIRIPPLTEGRMVTASSEGTVTQGPAPKPVVIEPSRRVASATTIETPNPEFVTTVVPAATVEPKVETSTDAEATPATPAPTITAMPTDLAGLEAQLVAAEKLPLEQQPLDALLAGYEALYSQPGQTPNDRRLVLQRIIKLRRNIALAATLREIGQMQHTLSTAPPVPERPIAAPIGPRAPSYSAVGQLLASGVYDGVNMPRLYRIVSPRMRTIAYVRPTSTLDAVAMLGKIVGVEGETRYDQSLKLQVMEPTSIVVLSPEAATVSP